MRVVCPFCGCWKNTQGSRYCQRCGQPLRQRCAKVQGEIVGGDAPTALVGAYGHSWEDNAIRPL